MSYRIWESGGTAMRPSRQWSRPDWLKDTSHRTVAPIFSEGAGIDSSELQGGADVVKRAEVARYNSTVTDWEQREYFDLF
jgi:hypothetical protein